MQKINCHGYFSVRRLEELGEPVLTGTLSFAHTKGREIFSFAYDKGWLDKDMPKASVVNVLAQKAGLLACKKF